MSELNPPAPVPFAGLSTNGWRVIGWRNRQDCDGAWYQDEDAPLPLSQAMHAAQAGEIIAQRHEAKISYLLHRARS